MPLGKFRSVRCTYRNCRKACSSPWGQVKGFQDQCSASRRCILMRPPRPACRRCMPRSNSVQRRCPSMVPFAFAISPQKQQAAQKCSMQDRTETHSAKPAHAKSSSFFANSLCSEGHDGFLAFVRTAVAFRSEFFFGPLTQWLKYSEDVVLGEREIPREEWPDRMCERAVLITAL